MTGSWSIGMMVQSDDEKLVFALDFNWLWASLEELSFLTVNH
jgi:hypothetical protein